MSARSQKALSTGPTLADQAYRALREEIISGKLEPGERLTERHLATRLVVSPTPIREALQRLEHEHLIQRTEQFRLETIPDIFGSNQKTALDRHREHGKIVAALKARDGETAEELMREHILGATGAFLRASADRDSEMENARQRVRPGTPMPSFSPQARFTPSTTPTDPHSVQFLARRELGGEARP